MPKYYGKYKDPEYRRQRAREYYRENRERIVQQYRDDPEAISNKHRRNRYKITDEEIVSLFQKTNGKCYICNKEGTLRGRASLVIDHDHETGKVRGLLCRGCNVGLHYLENKEWNAKAHCYLSGK